MQSPSPTTTSAISSSQLCELLRGVLEQKSGNDIVTIDLRGKADFADFMLIASGTSSTHMRALADYASRACKEHDVPILSVTGKEDNRWILVDTAVVVIHIFYPEAREYYDLEGVWNK